jgi:2-polyprenyl-3-methyl-5-hydroxy-6-metoxy-1,4-benzoquinol methylase
MQKCPICNNTGEFFLRKKKAPLSIFPIPNTVKINLINKDLLISCCAKCQLLFQSKELNKNLINKFYKIEQSYYTSLINNPKLYSLIEIEFLNFLKNCISKYFGRKKISLCEIGGFDGFIIKKIKNLLSDHLLIEPNYKGASIAKKNNINTLNEYLSINTLKKVNKKYDIVLSRHVIEHVKDIYEFKNLLSKILKKDGLIIIETPSLEKIFKRTLTRVFIHQHVWYFSEFSLSKLFLPFKIYASKVNESNNLIVAFSRRKISNNKKYNNFNNNNFNYNIFNFNKQIVQKKNNIKKFIKNNKNKIYAYGASSQVNDLINVYGVKESSIIRILDTDPKKASFKIPSLPKTKIEFINEFNFKKNYGIIVCTASHSKVNKILNKYNHSGQRFYL